MASVKFTPCTLRMLLFAATSNVGQLRTYRLRAMQQGAAHAPCLSDSLLSPNLVCRSAKPVSIGFNQFFKLVAEPQSHHIGSRVSLSLGGPHF